jgi:hypothetical protein
MVERGRGFLFFGAARRAALRLPGGGFDFAALRARKIALRRSLGRLCGAQQCACPAGGVILLPCGHCVSPPGEVGDACAARGKVGPVMGLRPLRGSPCIPPEAPPKRGFQLPQRGEGTRLLLRELPSLATLAQVISLRDA